MAACDDGVDDDVIAFLDPVHARSDPGDDAGKFVTDHTGIDGEGIRTVQNMYVRPADAGANDAYEDLVASGLGGRIGLDGEDFRLTDSNARHMIT